MSNKDNGGTAFPIGGMLIVESHGMTLRDYFAAKAMPEVIAMAYNRNIETKDGKPATESVIAEQAYAFADAMIAERAK